VQTVRVATRPMLADMASDDASTLEAYAATLQEWCAAYELDYCSLGAVPAGDPAFPVERIALLPRLLGPHEALNATVQLASVAAGIRYEAALPTAHVMRELAEHGDGDANFRFAALACCEPGGPFFPQAYAAGPQWSVSVGLQSAGLVGRTIEALVERSGSGLSALAGLTVAVGEALERAARPVVDLVREQARNAGFTFGGIDLSPAPMGGESIADALETVGLGIFGSPGTLAVAAALTAAIKSPDLLQCGYCGLMLPVLEDETLGERCAEGAVSVHSLLAYSAVCGTGLDTVPIAGDTPPERVAALLVDVAALAVRLRKPLSARLFLVPGGAAGDITNFASPYLTNTRILSV
ncbi:MAG: DUF711 family protein, partial [Ktedonobacterales bacterium]